MPYKKLTQEQNDELIVLFKTYPDFFSEVFGLSFVRNMRLNSPEIGVADENRLNDFIKIAKTKLTDNADSEPPAISKIRSAIEVLEKIKAKIKSHPKDATELHEASLFSFKSSLEDMDKKMFIRDDLDNDGSDSNDLLKITKRDIEKRKNFFESTELGIWLAELLLNKDSQAALIALAEAFNKDYPETVKKRAQNKAASKAKLNLLQAEITATNPSQADRDAMLQCIFSGNKQGNLSENEALYRGYILPLITTANFKDQVQLDSYLPTIAATVYRLWMRKFLESDPSAEDLNATLQQLIQIKIKYMDRDDSYKASNADTLCTEMIKLLLDAGERLQSDLGADIALIQAIAFWSPEERAFITKESKLSPHNQGEWELSPAPNYPGAIGLKCTVTTKDGKTVILTRKHVIIEDFDYDAITKTHKPTKVTSFMTYKGPQHLIVAKDILSEHTIVKALDGDSQGTVTERKDSSLLDYIPIPAEFNKTGKGTFSVAVYDPDTSTNIISRKVAANFTGISSIPENMTISKENNFLSFNINKLLGISSEEFTIAFTPGIDPQIGKLIHADTNGDITLEIRPRQPTFSERDRMTTTTTHNFDASVDLRFQIIPKVKDDNNAPTSIALNVPLADLQNPAVKSLKPRLKIIVSKDYIQEVLYVGMGIKTKLELIHPKNAFSPMVVEVAKFVDTELANIIRINQNKTIVQLLDLCSTYMQTLKELPKDFSTADIDSMIEDLKTHTLNAAVAHYLLEHIQRGLQDYKGDNKEQFKRDFEDLQYSMHSYQLDRGRHRKHSF